MKITKRKKRKISETIKAFAVGLVAAFSPVAAPRTGTDEKKIDAGLIQPQHDEDEDYREEYQGDPFYQGLPIFDKDGNRSCLLPGKEYRNAVAWAPNGQHMMCYAEIGYKCPPSPGR